MIILRAACLQSGIALEKCLNRCEKWLEKRQEGLQISRRHFSKSFSPPKSWTKRVFFSPRGSAGVATLRYLFTNVATILTSVCFPILCIIYFDHDCLGKWIAWWDPCSLHRRKHFTVDIKFYRRASLNMVRKSMEVCLPRRGQSCSICAMAIALKMQSMLMAKTITTSLVMPLKEISTGRYPKDFALVSHYLAICDPMSCDTPYTIRHKNISYPKKSTRTSF